jgi:hypothetical protein
VCLFVWIGSQRPVARVVVASETWSRVEEVPDDAPVRAHFASPCVAYVGAHEGCGCGFQSQKLFYDGLASVAEAIAYEDAMTGDERDEFRGEQRSRALLYGLITEAVRDGDVELYACWVGNEAQPPADVQLRAATWLLDDLIPFAERTRYLVRA